MHRRLFLLPGMTFFVLRNQPIHPKTPKKNQNSQKLSKFSQKQVYFFYFFFAIFSLTKSLQSMQFRVPAYGTENTQPQRNYDLKTKSAYGPIQWKSRLVGDFCEKGNIH